MTSTRKLFLIILILLALGALAFVYFQKESERSAAPGMQGPYSRGPSGLPKISEPPYAP